MTRNRLFAFFMVAALIAACVLPACASSASRSWLLSIWQVGLAILEYQKTHGHFPADCVDVQGKPILSWRVTLLPFMDQKALALEFDLQEPWDGPNNKALIDEIAYAYANPFHDADRTHAYFAMP